MNNKTVTEKKLKNWLVNNQCCNKNAEIKGFQKENQFSTSLTPWIDFTNIFGKIDQSNFELIENIIYDLTVFEDKKIVKRRLKKKYALSNDKIKQILKLKYRDWSRLSKKLLDGIVADNRFGSSVTILDVLEMSRLNLMEIINDKELGYSQMIEEAASSPKDGKFTYKEVEKLAGSPALKRGIWQALQIVEEITKVMKCKPKYIYIEFERSEEAKERTESKIKKLENVYKDLDEQTKKEYKRALDELKKFDNTKKISSDSLFLYFTQLGKCMYSGKDLDIDSLDKCQIDHIVPQSLVKDDSFDNRVLVIPNENQRKLDDLVVPSDIRVKMYSFWKLLFDHELISPKKFYSLIKTEYTERDQERFINRQLVETRQITKNVTQIIEDHYSTTTVAAIRANLSHEFRVKNHIYKNRDINDYHHAHDAYIVALIGGFMRNRYPNMHDSKAVYSEYMKMFRKNKNDKKRWKDGFVINSMNYPYEVDGEVIWNPDIINEIRKCFYYKDCYCTTKLDQKSGQMFNLTVLPNDAHSAKGTTEAVVPVNKARSNVNKYGGFSGLQYIIVAIEGKKKRGKKFVEVRTLAGVPLHLKAASLDEKIKYIEEKKGLSDVKIIKDNIPVNQMIEMDGGEYLLTSPTEYVNGRQLVLNEKQCALIEDIYNAMYKGDYDNLEDVLMIQLYIELTKKMKALYPAYVNIAERFENMNEDYVAVSKEEKANIIKQMLFIMHRGPQKGNIVYDDFKISGEVGRLRSKNHNLNNITFVSQSPTGIYFKKYKL